MMLAPLPSWRALARATWGKRLQAQALAQPWMRGEQEVTGWLSRSAWSLALVAILLLRMRASILRQLGGEPRDAAESMRRIASGDLSVDIRLAKGDDTSMMASLKLMQMKLTNITSAIQDNTVALSDQVRKFDAAAKAYAETRSEEQLPAVFKAVAKIGKTAEILNRSIARFKL